jgi:hypothetical protein
LPSQEPRISDVTLSELILRRYVSTTSRFLYWRTVYGDRINVTTQKWRWMQELGRQRENDIKTEMA